MNVSVSRDKAAEGVCKEQLHCYDKKRQHPNPFLIHRVCFLYLSRAVLVAMLLAKPLTPCCLKKGMAARLAAMTASESDGFTKKPFSPRIMYRS